MRIIIADNVAEAEISPGALAFQGSARWQEAESGLYGAVLGVLESRSPGLLAFLASRWEKGRTVAEHVLKTGRKVRLDKIDAAAVEAVLVLSRERQLPDPAAGMRLAQIAVEWSERRTLDSYKATGWILLANAARLRRLPRTCRAALKEASRFLRTPTDDGLYARALGLLRHEQGRGLEAASLLGHAQECFQAKGFEGEAASCLGLRCLLELEAGRWNFEQFVKAFPQALIAMEEAAHPGLYSAVRSAWAWVLATGDRRTEAEEILRDWKPPRLEGLELAPARVLFGRARRELGAYQDAERWFEGAFETYWSFGRRYEAALAGWELGLEYARREAWSELGAVAERFTGIWSGYGEMIEQAIRELRWTFKERQGMPSSLWLRVVLEGAGLGPGPVLFA